MNKTVRGDGSVISSGIDPARGGTMRADDKVITSGVQAQGPQVISAGITNLTGDIILNNNTYQILKPISASGEAEVFLIERDNQRSIFKYYYSNFKPKDSVLAQLKGIHHEDIVDLLDYGYHSGRFFEILEYAEGGSFLEVNEAGEYKYIPIRDIGKIKQIVEETVNALHFCHSRNMIHRDIKPGNLFFKNPDGTDILIGDFGISSALDEGLSKRMTGKARTAVYAAPELYQSVEGKTIVGKEIDYYAVGISLIHIWTGEEPFKELGELSIMRVKSEGKVDIPDAIPEEIGNLIRGLITVEPSKRWGYEEVQKWLRGEYVPVQVSSVEKRYKDFHFGVIDGEEVIVNDPEELARLLEKYPDKGKKHLYKGTIQTWLEDVNQSLYIEVRGIVEDEYPTDEDAGLIKAVYTLDPGKPFETAGGVKCKNSAVIGDQIEKEKSYYKTALVNNLNADLYMFLEAQGYKKEADTFRNYAKLHKNEPEVVINNIILDLHSRDKFCFEGKIFHRPEDFLAADDSTKADIVSILKDPQSRVSIWLEGFSQLKGNIETWIKLGRYNAVTLVYALDEKSPFNLKDERAENVVEFNELFAKHLKNDDFIMEITLSDSKFVEEADFWLKNYWKVSFLDAFFESHKSKFEQAYESREISEEGYNRLKDLILRILEGLIKQVVTDINYDYRNELIDKVRSLDSEHPSVKRHEKEERLLDAEIKEMIKALETKKQNQFREAEKKFEYKIEERKRKKKEEYDKKLKKPVLWAVGLGVALISMLFVGNLGKGAEGGILPISAIVFGIIGSVWASWYTDQNRIGSKMIGIVFIGGILTSAPIFGAIGSIMLFVIIKYNIYSIVLTSVVLLFFIIKIFSDVSDRKSEISKISITPDDKRSIENRKQKIERDIEGEKEIFNTDILVNIYKMTDDELDKNLIMCLDQEHPIVKGHEQEEKLRKEEEEKRKKRQLQEERLMENKRRKKGLCVACGKPVGFQEKMRDGLYCKDDKKLLLRGKPRFSTDNNGIITDLATELQWFVGPDEDTGWNQANSFANSLSIDGGGWRMPIVKELEELYFKGMGSQNMPLAFKDIQTTSWVWSGEAEATLKRIFRFSNGEKGTCCPLSIGNVGRAFAVRPWR